MLHRPKVFLEAAPDNYSSSSIPIALTEFVALRLTAKIRLYFIVEQISSSNGYFSGVELYKSDLALY